MERLDSARDAALPADLSVARQPNAREGESRAPIALGRIARILRAVRAHLARNSIALRCGRRHVACEPPAGCRRSIEHPGSCRGFSFAFRSWAHALHRSEERRV